MSIQSKHRCPACLKQTARVLYTRQHPNKDEPVKDVFMRRRLCKECNQRWSTVEISYQQWKLFRKIIKLVEERERVKQREQL